MKDKTFKLGDKVRNGHLVGKIIEVKEGTRLGTVYLVKYSIRSIGRIFNRKLWSMGLLFEHIDEEGE